MSETNKPSAEQLAKFKQRANDMSLSEEVRAKFRAIVEKFEDAVEDKPAKTARGKKYKTLPKPKRVTMVTATKESFKNMKDKLKKLGYNPEEVDNLSDNEAHAILLDLLEDEPKPKKTPAKRGRKPASTSESKADAYEKAKADLKKKTGKTEEECESIIEQYRELRAKAQTRKAKEEQASKDNKNRLKKLEDKGDLIAGTNVKTADAVIESTAKDVAEKIEQQIEAIEDKAEKEAKAEVAKDKTIKTPQAKKDAVADKVKEKVAQKTKPMIQRIVIDTSELLTSIATSLGKLDKDSQKEFLIKLRSDIDKLLSKFAFGGMTDGAVQTMNIQQSNLSASSVNPTLFANGGSVEREKVDTLIAKRGEEYYFLDDVFEYKDGFKGATGTIVVPVSKDYYEYATSYDGIVERYVDSMGEDEWLDVLGLDKDDFEDEGEMIEAIEEGIYALYRNGELNPFEEPNYDMVEQMRDLPQFKNEDKYPIFEVIGGGRIFNKDNKFDKIYNKKLYNRIKTLEEFAKGGMTEHGLKVGDKIEKKVDSNGEVIRVKNKKENAFVMLDKGHRMRIGEFSTMAKGGGVGSILRNRRGY